jgi:hypothetical protein
MQVRDAELKELLGDARFFSVTYRLFKLPEAIETPCEDYGQACKYLVSEHHCSQSNCWAGHCRAQGTVEPGAAGLGLGLPGLRSACLPARPLSPSIRCCITPACACRPPAPCLHPQGTIPGHAHSYALDDHHTFQAGKWYEVCGNTGKRGQGRGGQGGAGQGRAGQASSRARRTARQGKETGWHPAVVAVWPAGSAAGQ